MSRGEEKAQTMLNRWVAIEKELILNSKEKRPKDPNYCNNLQDCNKWRNQINKEISNKVNNIQNASLGETAIRQLNDEINKLFEEKNAWEDRIKKLGGKDYKKLLQKSMGSEGYEVPNSGGYRYWGAAKDLPGVRELFMNKPKEVPKKNYMDMYKGIDLEYYGIYDKDLEMGYDEREGSNEGFDKEKDKDDVWREIEKEEKNMESLLYLEYLDKLNKKDLMAVENNK